ncbi:hypothetical protein HU200_012012 [Digitaria exilis]|uniref:Uncharacterized protein n=1 Tax=Digitaria exilis TaxID=1010633 RepID=A0A835FG73_9POAL|nr:hypothetical protein HU200_012012 [Digitaria exilis]
MAGASELQELLAFDSSNHGQETGQGMAGDFPQLPLLAEQEKLRKKAHKEHATINTNIAGIHATHDGRHDEKMKGVEPFQDMESSDATASKVDDTAEGG